MTRIVCISDTHGRHEHLTSKGMGSILPEGDLLLHAGDLTNVGGKGEVQGVLDWLIEIAPRYTHGVVFIAGNHDRGFDPKYNLEGDTKPEYLKQRLQDLNGVTYLENSSCMIDGIKIWGSPITPWFYGDRWAFNKHRGDEINEVWRGIPDDTDIIITHGPAKGYGDFTVNDRSHVGCEHLRYRIHEIKPKLHVFGHIHEGAGVIKEVDITYINASILDERYEVVNKPVIFNYEN